MKKKKKDAVMLKDIVKNNGPGFLPWIVFIPVGIMLAMIIIAQILYCY